MTRVRRLVEACGFKTIGELDAEKVEECLKEIRRDGGSGCPDV